MTGQVKPAEQWAIVELLGHVRLAGKLSEHEFAGTKLGRLDIPQMDGSFATRLFGAGSVYAITFVGETEARAVALSVSAPVSAWEMRPMLTPAQQSLPAANQPEAFDLYDAAPGTVVDDDDAGDDSDLDDSHLDYSDLDGLPTSLGGEG